MLEATLDRLPHLDELVGDKGFDGDPQREACLDEEVNPVIPNKSNRADPWPFDREIYKGRNCVERFIAKGKQFRRVSTRYEKLKATFLGVIHLVFGFIRVRSNVNRA